jgi:signal transduction histidine kinase
MKSSKLTLNNPDSSKQYINFSTITAYLQSFLSFCVAILGRHDSPYGWKTAIISYNQIMSRHAPKQQTDLASRTKWYVKIRWFLLIAIGAPGLISQAASHGFSKEVQIDIILGILALASNGIFYIVTHLPRRSDQYYRDVAGVLLILDVLLVTFLVFIKGGIESRSVILYAIPITMSAAIFGRKLVYATAAVSSLMYSALIFGDYAGVIHTLGVYTPELHTRLAYVIETVVFFSAVIMLVGASVDFITQLLAEKEHQVSENLAALKMAQSIAHMGSWEWDIARDQQVWSDEMYAILGVAPTAGPVDWEKYLARIHPDDQALVKARLKNAIHDKRAFSFDYRVPSPDGSVQYFHGQGRPIANRQGETVKMVGTVQDITESVMLDEAKSDFVALASHQLRTPATGVKQYLGMLLDGYAGKLTAHQRGLLLTAYESNERQLNIVDDLLHVAQVDSGRLHIRPTPVDLVALLQDIAKEQSQQFEITDQLVVLQTKYKQLFCPVDARHFRMVIENLVDNAHKYTPSSEAIVISLSKTPDTVRVSVADKGVGIAKSDLHKLFLKFSRIDNPVSKQVGGTGLGLYWVSKLVAMHNGTIEVKSKPGEGTKFTVIIPSAQKATLKNHKRDIVQS